MNTQYRKNLKAVLEASKTYCDESINTLKWELGTYDLSVDSDTTTAYQKVVPTNSIEAKINTLGGMSYKCNNLFNINSNSFVSAGTNYTVSGDTLTTDSNPSYLYLKVSVKTNTDYYINCVFSGTTNLEIFDDNITSKISDSGNTFNSGNNTEIAVIFYPNGVYSNIMLNEGTTVLPYELYFEGIRDTAITNAKSVGFNIWDEEVKNGYYNPSTGEYVSNSDYLCSKNKCSIMPNTTYKAKIPANIDIQFWDENNTFISDISIYLTVANSQIFTTPSNARYFTLYITDSYGTTYNNDICINISNASLNGTYKPYFTASLLIPAQVQALDGYGWGINSTCYNYIDFNAKKFIKKVDEYIFTGNEVWIQWGEAYYSYVGTNAISDADQKNAISTIGEVTDNQTLYDGTTNSYNLNGSAIYISSDLYNNVSNLTGKSIFYELATPIETDISAYLTTNKITVEGNGTLTAENTYGASVPSDIDYLKEVKA